MALNKKFDMEDIDFAGVRTIEEIPVREPEKSVEPEKPIDITPQKTEDVTLNTGIFIASKKKELKTVHKNFLISEELNDKFKALAKKTGYNENALFNEILKQVLK